MIPTTSETLDALIAICEQAQLAIREIGQIEGKNDLSAEEALIEVIVRRSKAILQTMPYLQLEDDGIEELDSKLCYRLNQIEEESAR
jgi:tRNA1(Val) A37 N6-methylase TrmN6